MKVFHVDSDVIIAVDKIFPNNALTARQQEHKAEELLLKNLLGDVELRHNEEGKPLLDDYKISISHTVNRNGGFVAVILSKGNDVGIDIEYVSDRVMKIASRFLRIDEQPRSVVDHLVYWCAKETAYKLFSVDDLTYLQMYVNPSMDYVLNVKRNVSVPIHRKITSDYVLVWTKATTDK